MRVQLLDDEFLLPDLKAFLAAQGFLVANAAGSSGTVEVFAPTIASGAEASARISATATGWAALRGVPITLVPAVDRRAYPLHTRVESDPRAALSTEPTVSIGLPVFNGGEFLGEALDSLLSQTYADFELIICDNASEDETREICETYASKDERIRYLRSDVNRGAAWNYNRVLAEAVGRYFKWASHDDLCAPTYLERCVEVLDRAPDSVVLTYPKTVLIDIDGNFLGPYEDGLNLRQAEPYQRLRTLSGNLVMSNAVFGLIRRDVLNRTRGHGTYISADYVLLAELALQGQFWEIPEPLFLRRDHPGMSRRAHTNPSELAEWFETGAGNRQSREFLRLFGEHLLAVRGAPNLSAIERLRAYASLVRWLRRFHRKILREVNPIRRPPEESQEIPSRVARASQIERINVHESIRTAVWSIAPDYLPQVRIQADPRLTVDADRAALDRILLNLVSNAVRYGHSPVTISAEAQQDFVLTVEDQGRGISPDFLPHLFEPFSRSNESEHASPGLGLGLAIAQMSALDCGGTLISESSDHGACFRLTLPGQPDAEAGATRGTFPVGRPSPPQPGTLRMLCGVDQPGT